jgi:hypothetical protein
MVSPANPESSYAVEHDATAETATEVLEEDDVVDNAPANINASPDELRVSLEPPANSPKDNPL